ncbi:MAG: glycosyltransferase family 9 protein [Akkermansia muciniphila]|nr:glycosyltransferase family 9 protein [Akkermansia muciniphila]
METKKILFVKHGALGDIVMSIGTIRHIAEQFPGAQCSVMTKAPFRKLMEHIGIFSEYIIDNRTSWWNIPAMYRVLNALRTGGYDIIVDLMGNGRMHRYREILSCTAPKGSCWEWWDLPGRTLYRSEKRSSLLPAHTEVQRNYPFRYHRTDLSFMHGKGEHFHLLPERFVLLIPGCSPQHAYKRWPVENYREVVRRLHARGLSAVIIGTKAEAAEINAICADNPGAVNMLGLTELFDVPQIALRALATLGNDTGPTHMASLSGAFTISLLDQRNKASGLIGPDSISLTSPGNVDRLSVDEVWGQLEPRLG